MITAADLLFGSTEGAHEALTRHVMSAGRTTARAFERLPRVTREAAVREAAAVAVGLLKVDLMEVLVSGWREHRDIFTAARRTLDIPGSKELVGLAPHRITTVQQPSVGILVDNHRVHTLQLGLSIFFEVTGLVAGIHAGRLAAVHAGRGELGLALTIHELEVLTKRSHLELPGVKSLQRGFRLLPASAYPDESHGHPGSQHPGGHPSGAPAGRRAAGRRDGGRPLPRRRPEGRPGPGHQPPRRRACILVRLRRPRCRRAHPGRTHPHRAARRRASEQRRDGPLIRLLVAEIPHPTRPHPHPLAHPTRTSHPRSPPPPAPLPAEAIS